ncbi:hypothetical protein CR159_19795 [Pollutimonas subterranea]|uniref:Uncharacterized protein n=1 Tax=Pollutimonas subterranea TaxID=2045210 RepID=A0A2N4TZH0_9BURK|nr:hypothetical protein [Pollutimonas subterranea]PLC48166.1 hypothetical protein CR159_19795 [Pollutimonas subterranea]
MANPIWFNKEDYLTSKLAQLRAAGDNTYSNIVTLDAALVNAGFTAFSHFEAFGSIERTSPNKYFNATEYLAAKAVQLNSVAGNTKVWTADNVALAIKDAGMTVWGHYQAFALTENVNPSNSFDVSSYMADKLAQLQAAEPAKGWTAEQVKDAFVAGGLDPISHYVAFGTAESLTVKPVPAGEQVPSDSSSGQVFTLTAAAQTLVGTSGNDTFVGVVDAVTTANTTLSVIDSINGGAGTDTLVVTTVGTVDVLNNALISNIEAVSIRNTEATTGGLASISATGLSSGVTATGTGDITVTNLANGVAFTANGATGAPVISQGYVPPLSQ